MCYNNTYYSIFLCVFASISIGSTEIIKENMDEKYGVICYNKTVY